MLNTKLYNLIHIKTCISNKFYIQKSHLKKKKRKQTTSFKDSLNNQQICFHHYYYYYCY